MVNLNSVSGTWFPGDKLAPINSDVRIDVINPADCKPVGFVAVPSSDAVDSLLGELNAAQKQWAKVDPKTRASYLHRIADSIESADHRDVAEAMVLEMGKPYPEALGEIANIAPAFRYMAEMARDDGGYIAGTTQLGSFQYCRYEPLGVSVHIMPFNFPLLLMAWTVAASLASGNACVIKPSEATSLCTLLFMKHFSVLPENLVACVPGNHLTGEQLVRSKQTHAVAFTGSVTVGKAVNLACAESMKPVVIEAGGNDAFIVSNKADVDVAVAGAVTAAFHLSGQVCTSAERFFVHEDVYDEFLEKFSAMTQTLRIGTGFEKAEIGPVASVKSRDRILGLIADARAEGARLVCGGEIPAGREGGAFMTPTILADVTPAMSVMQSEVFGPVASVCKVSSFDEAIELANRSEFGLGASVFTTCMIEAAQAAEEIVSGMVWINNPLIDNDALPFGGRKLSGVGRELGRQGLNTFRAAKMVIQDAKSEKQDWWYPYNDDAFWTPE